MSTDFGKAHEVLGVKPGVSAGELKAAHRDLAKVWHPDRFLHDPRLQQKAQEKLKEINEAYDQLISGRTARPTPPSYQPAYQPPPSRVRRQQATRPSRGYGFALLTFLGVFALTISTLLQGRAPGPAHAVETSTEPAEQVAIGSTAPAVNRTRKPSSPSEKPDQLVTSVVPPVEPLATVTVDIDPYTGLLATPNCPVRTSMTYPSGGQPHGYCKARHPPRPSAIASKAEPEKDSTIKSLTKRLGL